jgi:glycosyltransferase involved in cell wall biosynthesis
MSLADLHPVIITRDAAATIERTLESLARFPEVVVFDNGSRDETKSKCAAFANVKLIEGEFAGFGPTKNRAASFASGDWIVSLDADEYLSEELLHALERADLSDHGTVYLIERHNLMMGRQVKHGGWGRDWLVRVYHRRTHAFTNAMVHEKIALTPADKVVRLDGALWHQAVTEIDQFLSKISRYSELRRGVPGRVYGPFAIALRAAWAFVRSYVFQLGFVEGWRGLVIAVSTSNGSFYKHMKAYVDERLRRDTDQHGSGRP